MLGEAGDLCTQEVKITQSLYGILCLLYLSLDKLLQVLSLKFRNTDIVFKNK